MMKSPDLSFYALTVASPRRAGNYAERAERAGWDGMAVVDSQNLSGDAYVALTVAALRTERLGLATAVTNPVTRHPAVTASAIASVHALSGGRAVLGIGRGDSSLAHLGRAPASVSIFAKYLKTLQCYLRGESVPFEELAFHERLAPEVATLGLADTAESSRIALKKAGLQLDDMDLIEINEAFSAQYLAVEKELGLPREKTNVNGGAIAIGHPVGVTGARLTLTKLLELRRRGGKYGLAGACIGGGMGLSVIVEAL